MIREFSVPAGETVEFGGSGEQLHCFECNLPAFKLHMNEREFLFAKQMKYTRSFDKIIVENIDTTNALIGKFNVTNDDDVQDFRSDASSLLSILGGTGAKNQPLSVDGGTIREIGGGSSTISFDNTLGGGIQKDVLITGAANTNGILIYQANIHVWDTNFATDKSARAFLNLGGTKALVNALINKAEHLPGEFHVPAGNEISHTIDAGIAARIMMNWRPL